MFYLRTHSTHFIYGYMAWDIWLRTTQIVREETRCRHMGYSFRLTARVLLYAQSHRQDSTYHGLWYTSRGALAGTRNSSMGPPHEGSIRRPIAPWANRYIWEIFSDGGGTGYCRPGPNIYMGAPICLLEIHSRVILPPLYRCPRLAPPPPSPFTPPVFCGRLMGLKVRSCSLHVNDLVRSRQLASRRIRTIYTHCDLSVCLYIAHCLYLS